MQYPVFAIATGRGPRRHIPAEYGIIQREPGITLCGRPANGDNIDSMDDLPTATCRTCQKAWVGC